MINLQEETEEWYKKYEGRTGSERNDGLKNPEVTFQRFAFDASIISALRSMKIKSYSIKILDVGCGSGGSFFNFLRLGFDPHMMYGLDILPNRIDEGRQKFPNINFTCGDASNIKFPDNTFDLVFEVGMFIQLTSDEISEKIAQEMLRVVKPEGYIMLVDWRYSKPGVFDYKGLSKGRIADIFKINKESKLCGVYNGALVPPIGRFLSKKLPSTYFLVQSIFPFFVGQIATVLQKKN
jgi:ubiquinone/menaquinone biosynthesis C-methylase UbiE